MYSLCSIFFFLIGSALGLVSSSMFRTCSLFQIYSTLGSLSGVKMIYFTFVLIRFVAGSTGHQASSRLLSMKSANALLELPALGTILSAGTSITAVVISDLSGFTMSKSLLQPDSGCATRRSMSQEVFNGAFQGSEIGVAILTVSDTVAQGTGPDRR